MEYLTIKLRAQDLYSVIVNLGCALVNHNIQKLRENNLKFKYKSSELYLNPLHGDTLKTPRNGCQLVKKHTLLRYSLSITSACYIFISQA